MSFGFYDSNQQAINNIQGQRALSALQKKAETEDSIAEIARLQAQKRLNDYKSGTVTQTAKEREDSLSDFEKRQQLGDYDFKNQLKAWDAASKYRMTEADQSNVAQKDRLVAQLDTQKELQDRTISQENRVKSDDYNRAVNGFKLSF
jgi:hypothetical protein